MIVKQSLYKVHPRGGGILRFGAGDHFIGGSPLAGLARLAAGLAARVAAASAGAEGALAARAGLFRRGGGVGAVDRGPGAGIEPGEGSRPGVTTRRIQDDFLALVQALGDLDQLRGRPADLHGAPFQVLADGDEADFALAVGEDRFMGYGDDALAQG